MKRRADADGRGNILRNRQIPPERPLPDSGACHNPGNNLLARWSGAHATRDESRRSIGRLGRNHQVHAPG